MAVIPLRPPATTACRMVTKRAWTVADSAQHVAPRNSPVRMGASAAVACAAVVLVRHPRVSTKYAMALSQTSIAAVLARPVRWAKRANWVWIVDLASVSSASVVHRHVTMVSRMDWSPVSIAVAQPARRVATARDAHCPLTAKAASAAGAIDSVLWLRAMMASRTVRKPAWTAVVSARANAPLARDAKEQRTVQAVCAKRACVVLQAAMTPCAMASKPTSIVVARIVRLALPNKGVPRMRIVCRGPVLTLRAASPHVLTLFSMATKPTSIAAARVPTVTMGLNAARRAIARVVPV